MTRISCIIFAVLICVSAALAAVELPSTENEVAIVHFDKLKDKQLEGTAQNITLKPVTGSPNQTSYFALVNELYNPRNVTVRILGLTEPEYDLYMDGNLAGTMKKEQLEEGIPVAFSGTDIPPELRDYYSRLKAKSAAGAKECPTSDEDTSLCQAVMRDVASWVDSIERGDVLIRTTTVIVVPAGTPLFLPGGRYVFNKPPNFPRSAKHLGEAVQIIRGEVQKKTKNAVLRYDTLSYITPVDFDMTASSAISPGTKVKLKAKLTNWTDRGITGKIRLDVPKGWTVKPLSPVSVKTTGYSQSAEALFEVVIPKTAKPDAKINAVADLLIGDVRLMLNASIKK
ncbi:MAG: NEW3 domain-containing protein [Armatimonadota bacterium]